MLIEWDTPKKLVCVSPTLEFELKKIKQVLVWILGIFLISGAVMAFFFLKIEIRAIRIRRVQILCFCSKYITDQRQRYSVQHCPIGRMFRSITLLFTKVSSPLAPLPGLRRKPATAMGRRAARLCRRHILGRERTARA